MSGGVDSPVATWLLKQQGYDVIGVAMQIWQDEDMGVQGVEGGYCSLSAMDNARGVAMDLGIPYYIMNFKEEFRKNVTDYFVGEYVEGKTPNPYIACNRYVRWESLLRHSMATGADYIVTGHYTQVEQLPNGRYVLKTPVTVEKDQTYALYNLTQSQLTHTLVPVGSSCKGEIHRVARDIGLQVAHKSDNQEIRFMPSYNYANFIEEYTGRQTPEGNFMDLQGNVLGRHEGISHYIIGQYKGLNLSMGRSVFVVEIRSETNEAVIGEGKDVFISAFRCNELSWMAADGLHEQAMGAVVKIRYSHRGASRTIQEVGPDLVECMSHESIRTAMPGQAVVFYQGDHMADGDTIIWK